MATRTKLPILLALLLPACSTMRPVQAPVSYLEQNNPRQIRVYGTDGELYVLRDPQLRGDSILGYESMLREEMRIPVGQIQRMEALQHDKGRTTVFISAMSVLGAAGIYMIANAGNGNRLYCDSYDNANRCVTRPPAIRFSIPVR